MSEQERLCEGRVVIVTGAGGGIGRAEALAFASRGAKVVVNDLGTDMGGSGRSSAAADAVVEEIRALGGTSVANADDVSDWDGSKRIIDTAIETFGRLDVVVNNAGILRDRMLFNMEEQDWDAVIKVHLKGAFCMARWAAIHWRDRAKAGEANDARIINTTSASGLFGNPGQANYGSAKAGVAALTVIASRELGRYGVTVNAISPGASTRMTAGTAKPDGWLEANAAEVFDGGNPDNIAPAVVWLGSTESASVTGRVIDVGGGKIGIAEGWRSGPVKDKGQRWEPEELGPVVLELVERSQPPSTIRDWLPD